MRGKARCIDCENVARGTIESENIVYSLIYCCRATNPPCVIDPFVQRKCGNFSREEIRTEVTNKVCPSCGGEMEFHYKDPGKPPVVKCNRCSLLARLKAEESKVG